MLEVGNCLNVGGIQHHTNIGAERLGREIVTKGSLHDARSAVWTSDTAPDDADFRTITDGLGAVDVGNALAQVELSLSGSLDAFDLNERLVLILGALSTFVTEDAALTMESAAEIKEQKRFVLIHVQRKILSGLSDANDFNIRASPTPTLFSR